MSKKKTALLQWPGAFGFSFDPSNAIYKSSSASMIETTFIAYFFTSSMVQMYTIDRGRMKSFALKSKDRSLAGSKSTPPRCPFRFSRDYWDYFNGLTELC